jgi:hypothetical protein
MCPFFEVHNFPAGAITDVILQRCSGIFENIIMSELMVDSNIGVYVG